MKKKVLFCIAIALVAFFCVVVKRYGKYAQYVYYFVSPQKSFITNDYRLNVDTDTLKVYDSGYGDWLVHPCVRYIPDGLGGAKWWMAVTPYPEGNSKYEQPILYYGTTNGQIPPLTWEFYGFIQEMPKHGYNADPFMYYSGKEKLLYIVWKECKTSNTLKKAYYNALMYRTFDGKKWGPIKKLLDNSSPREAKITAPSLLCIEDSLYVFATDFEYERDPRKVLAHGRSGIAVWKSVNNLLDEPIFKYQKRIDQDYPQSFDYWHTEFIYDPYEKLYYSTVTNENGFDLLFGVSKDGFKFKYSTTPLISFKDKSHSRNLYKASLVATKDSIYFFYPKREHDRRAVHIYYSSLNKRELLDTMIN